MVELWLVVEQQVNNTLHWTKEFKSQHKFKKFFIGSAAAVVAWWLECWTGDPGVPGSDPATWNFSQNVHFEYVFLDLAKVWSGC